MEQESKKISLKELSKVLVATASLEHEVCHLPLDDRFLEQVKNWSAGIFRIVVMGEIKQGKSSFINAMLGVPNLVPVNSDVATSTIFKIRYGKEQSYKVFFTEASKKRTEIVSESRLYEYGTEAGNPNNEKQVEFIDVAVPSPLLGSGLVIIDTPGLGGLFKHHKKITHEYAPKADAVFFVSDSLGSPLGMQEIACLEELKSITDNIYFVQTKADAADSVTRRSRMRNNVDILAAQVGFPRKAINYFIVDSNLKQEADKGANSEDLIDSGFPPLMKFINMNLRAKQKDIIIKRALSQALPKVDLIKCSLAKAKQILEADTLEEQQELETQNKKTQDAFKKWVSEEKPRLLTTWHKQISAIRQSAMDKLRKCAPNGEIHMEFDAHIDQASTQDDLIAVLDQIHDSLPSFLIKVMRSIGDQVKEDSEKALQDICQEACISLAQAQNESALSVLNQNGVKRQLNSLKAGVSKFDTIRTGFYGGMAGGTIASVVGGIIGSVVPIVGTIIGSGLGVMVAFCFGGYKALAFKETQELKSAKQQACVAIGQSLNSGYTQAQSFVEKILQDIQFQANEALQQMVLKTTGQLEGEIKEIQDRKLMTGKMLSDKKRELDKQNMCLQKIERFLQS